MLLLLAAFARLRLLAFGGGAIEERVDGLIVPNDLVLVGLLLLIVERRRRRLLVLEKLLGAPAEHIVELRLRHRRPFLADARAHNEMRKQHLFLRDRYDALLDRISRHKTIDHNLVLLADSVRTRKRLDVCKLESANSVFVLARLRT